MSENLVEVQRDLLAVGATTGRESKVFLETLKDKITKDPTVSMRRHAKTLNVDHKSCCHPGLGRQIFFQAATTSSHQQPEAKKV